MCHVVIFAKGLCLMQCMPASDYVASLSVTRDSSMHAIWAPRPLQLSLIRPHEIQPAQSCCTPTCMTLVAGQNAVRLKDICACMHALSSLQWDKAFGWSGVALWLHEVMKPQGVPFH